MADYDPNKPNPLGESIKRDANIKVAVRCRPPLGKEATCNTFEKLMLSSADRGVR